MLPVGKQPVPDFRDVPTIVTIEENPAVLVPLKRPEQSKTRLEPPLTGPERRRLSQALYEHLLGELEALRQDYPVTAVTNSDLLLDRARERGVTAVPESGGCSTLGEVIDTTIRRDKKRFENGVLVLPSDLPLVTERRVREYIDRCRGRPLVFNPDTDNSGTNAIWRNPPLVVSCQYRGTSSFDEHVREAEKAGVDYEITRREWIERDFDTVDDLDWLKEHQEQLSESLRATFRELFDLESPDTRFLRES